MPYNAQNMGFGPMMNDNQANFVSSRPRYGDIGNSMNQNTYNMGAQPRRQPNYIPGRMVVTESEVFPYEVPNDGTVAAFIQKDYQKVYLKSILGDGLVHTNEYVLVNGDDPSSQNPSPLDVILERLDRLEKKIDGVKPKQSNYYQKQHNNTKPQGKKQEVKSNGNE